MDRALWGRVKELVAAAGELPPGQREAYLRGQCGENEALRREVKELLSAGELAPDLLEQPAAQLFPDLLTDEFAKELIGKQVGVWRLTQLIAAGGMGVIYRGERAGGQFDQTVAVKLIRRELFSPDLRGRFERERRTLARLSHPNVARLLDGGITDEALPYLVMEFVEGMPIDEYCDRRKLATDERLKLFRQACAAVHYAHQNLVVHRDIKPNNILVTQEGVPKLIDFGIARELQEHSRRQAAGTTEPQRRRMTPQYASPEQIRGGPVTTATDIYSLGVTLYVLLTGHRPYRFRSGVLYDIERVICEEEPEAPSTAVTRTRQFDSRGDVQAVTPAWVSAMRATDPNRLRRHLAGDIDAIVLKALRKDPAQRYTSVEQFSEDIGRHLAGLPVIAQRPTLGYRMKKFVRRNRAGAIGAAAVAASFVLGLTGISWEARQAAEQRDIAMAAQRIAQQHAETAETAAAQTRDINEFLKNMLASVRPERAGREVTVREALDRAAERLEADLNSQPQVAAEVRRTLARSYESLGLYDDAERQLRTALQTLTELYDGPHADIAECRDDLAVVLYAKGRYAEAEAHCRAALEMGRRLFGSDSEQTAQTLNNLGAILARQGRDEQAESLYRQALKLRRTLLGDQHPAVAETLNNLGGVFRRRGDLAGAEQMAREVIAIREQSLGADHIDTARAWDNLAVLLHQQGKVQEAEQAYAHAQRTYREKLGPNHPDLATSISNLATLLFKQERTAEAVPLLREAVRIRAAALPADDSRTAYSRCMLGSGLTILEQFDEAEPLLQAALETYAGEYGDQDPRTQATLEALVKLYEAWNRPNKARTYRSRSGASDKPVP
jgi:serine/threonine protein kinase/tetratricopeptide (TPR) repeat protein